MPHLCGRTHSRRERHDTSSTSGSGHSTLTKEMGSTLMGGKETAAANPRPRVPTHQEIAELAYSYWEARGRRGGSPLEDWLRAERELHNPARS